MKNLMLSLFAGAALLTGFAGASQAKATVSVYLGVPYYNQQIAPDYVYTENHGWYRPDVQSAYYPGGRQNLVCLVTFFRPDQVAGGADADVQHAQILPRRIAQRYVTHSARNRIFTYGNTQQTRATCRYLNGLHNQQPAPSQDLVCLVSFFDADQVSAGADDNVARAQILPRRIAEQRVSLDDRNRIFVYGSEQKTRETCRYLDGINN